jgi:hypothetical protein
MPQMTPEQEAEFEKLCADFLAETGIDIKAELELCPPAKTSKLEAAKNFITKMRAVLAYNLDNLGSCSPEEENLVAEARRIAKSRFGDSPRADDLNELIKIAAGLSVEMRSDHWAKKGAPPDGEERARSTFRIIAKLQNKI